MSNLTIIKNDEYDRSFESQDRIVKLELFKLLHQVVTNNDPRKLDFVHVLNEGEESYFFTTPDNHAYITFELVFFGKIRFIACYSE